MKTRSKIKGLFAIVFALFMFSSVVTKAQCSKIINSTQCGFKIKVTLYDRNAQGCNLICNTFIAILPANSSMPVPCGNCVAPCNVEVSIITINGVSIPPVTADYYNGSQALPPNGCGASAIKYDPLIPAFVIF